MPLAPDAGTIVVIPARYESSRFPGKPLALIAGISLLERTWRRTCQAVDQDAVYVATDDQRIADHASDFGAQIVMTSHSHPTGTDRCHEVAEALDASLVINVQGDEPMVDPETISLVLREAQSRPGVTVNAMSVIADEDDFRSPNVPKVVAAPDGRLLYMSRAAIPTDKSLGFAEAMRQVCVYAFPRAALDAYASSPRTPLERTEDIEILRLLELGLPITMLEVAPGSLAVDAPADIVRVEQLLAT